MIPHKSQFLQGYCFVITILASLFFSLLPDGEVSASIYYVAKDGSDLKSGTIENPLLTIQKAADTMIEGDTVYIKEGTYCEQIRPKNSGASSSYITYQNYPGHTVWIDGEDTRQFGVIANEKSYLKFIGINVKRTYGPFGKNTAGFRLTGGSHIEIRETLVTHCLYKGIQIVGAEYVEIDNVNVNYTTRQPDATGGFGIVVESSSHVEIASSVSQWNEKQGIWITGSSKFVLVVNNACNNNGASGIQVEAGPKYIVLRGNTCSDNCRIYVAAETGIWVDKTDYAIVENNICFGNVNGMAFSDTRFLIARRNLIYNNTKYELEKPQYGGGIRINQLKKTSENNVLCHNTLHGNGHSFGNLWGGIYVGFSTETTRIAFKNNIVADTAGPFDLRISNGSSYYIANRNCFYNSRAVLIDWFGTWRKPIKINFDEYRSVSLNDSDTIALDPKFLDVSSANFTLQANSPCIDAGTFLTETSSSGSGATITVKDARYFTDGFGIIVGDEIMVGENAPVRVVKVDYSVNTISVDRNISWSSNDGVSYLFSGSAPDIGFYEYNWIDAPKGLQDHGSP